MSRATEQQAGSPLAILAAEDGSGIEALVERVEDLGASVRVQLTLYDGRGLSADLTPEQALHLELLEGQIRSVALRAA